MRISTIAFANLKRRKGKAIFLAIGITIGIGTAVALVSLSSSIREEIGTQLDRFGANIVVLPQSNSLSLDYGGVAVSGVSFDVHQLTNEDAKKILEIPYSDRLSLISPKLLAVVDVEGQQALLAGVDFKSEMVLKRWWHIVGQTPEDEQDVLVGCEAARALSIVEPGAEGRTQGGSTMVDMPGMASHSSADPNQIRVLKEHLQIAGREHRVAGVLAPTGGPDDRIIFGSLSHVQSLVNKPDQLSLIEVSALCKDCPVGDIVAQISEKLPHAKVSAIQQSVKARTETVERITRFSAAVAAIVLAIGALMIFTTMMASVIERTKEIGVLRAIGFRKSHIIKGLVIEVALISVVGGLLGWAVGMLASWLALPYFAETGVAFQVQPALAAVAVVAAVLIGIASSFYPIIRASRLDPSEAVRYV